MKNKKTGEREDEEFPKYYYQTLLPRKRTFQTISENIFRLNTFGIGSAQFFSFDKKRIFKYNSRSASYPEGLTKEEKEIFEKDIVCRFSWYKDENYKCVAEHPIFKRKFLERNEDENIYWVDEKDYPLRAYEFSFDKKKIYNLFRDYPWELTQDEKRIFFREGFRHLELENDCTKREINRLRFRNYLERNKEKQKCVYSIKQPGSLPLRPDDKKEFNLKKITEFFKSFSTVYPEFNAINELKIEEDGTVKMKTDGNWLFYY